ncbi:glucosamine-6-phosphate deaminase [Virgibacillus sp. W0181]|uniref:glucosamine-6-phosphate deaminase n=1 Tax=Virgibacillus sp. W0181 TaxID=3391581 RepID=UPI003F46E5F8
MQIIIVKDKEELAEKAISFLLKRVSNLTIPVLGLATGSTPIKLYAKMVEAYKQNNISFNHTKTFNLDEYVGLPKSHPNSFHYYMKHHLFTHVDISTKNTFLPNGLTKDPDLECLRYEQMIKKFGAIDLQILGLGVNGHIGFNEPGTSFHTRTHVVQLNEVTRQTNSKHFQSISEVPMKAITMGIGTIMDSKEILLLVSGKEKRTIIKKALYDKITIDIPASVLQYHPNVHVIVDEAAAKYI